MEDAVDQLVSTKDFHLPGLISSKQRQEEEASCASFLPMLKLLQGISSELENPANKAGDWFVQGDSINVGPQVEIAVYGRRDHALLLHGTTRVEESFIYGSPLYNKIRRTPINQAQGISVFHGTTDFLVWLPKYEKFVTLFMGAKSKKPIGLDIIEYCTPIEERNTELGKERIRTNVFILGSMFETERFGKAKRCHIPTLTPLDNYNKGSKPPFMEILNGARDIFEAPVKAEMAIEIKEATSKDVR